MTDFGNQLQNYAQGKSDKCQHPIKWVDNNRLCHQCNQYVPIREHKISETDQLRARIAELTEETDRANLRIIAKDMQIAELTRMLFALGKQDGQTIRNLTEENRGLRQMLHMEAK